MPYRVVGLIQQWTQALLWGLDNLEALTIPADTAPCSPVLGCLPKLRFLELMLWWPGAWLEQFCIDLSFCSCLESLELGQLDLVEGSWKLFEVQLGALPNLKHVELTGCFPGTEFHLPPECKLCVTVACHKDCPWKEEWRAMQRHLTVLVLNDLGVQEWPAGLEQLSRLQYLRLKCSTLLGQDIAVLKAIPHVAVFIEGFADLTLSDGAWQSHEVHGTRTLRIKFSDVDAFVRGTEHFLFVSDGQICQSMCAVIRAACSRQSKSCYQTRCRATIRLSNWEVVICSKHSVLGQITPSGGLHDVSAGTPETSAPWECARNNSLVSEGQFWPTWNPHKWVFGK